MVVRRGYRRPPSITRTACAARRSATSSTSSPTASAPCPTTRRRSAAADRWAIVAYIRALQLSEHATLADVPAGERDRIQLTAAHADRRRRDSRAGAVISGRLLLAGAVGAVVSLGGAFLNFTQFMQSYLMAYAVPRRDARLLSRSAWCTSCPAAPGASSSAGRSARRRACCR